MRRAPALLLLLVLAVPADGQGSLRKVEQRDLGEPKVERIHFEHLEAKPITNHALRAAMRTRVGERFQARFYRSDLSEIVNLYRSRGYLDVDIVRRRYYLDDRGRLHLHVSIDSGRQWRISAVDIEAAPGKAPLPDLESGVGVRAGDVLRYGDVLRDERALLGLLNRAGFPHAAVRNRLDFDAGKKLGAVTFEVRPGPRMYFGPVRLVDEDLQTRPSLIRRMITFREGALYDPEAVRASRNNLARTGLFRSVTLETPEQAAGDSVQPVVLRLQERPFRRLGARAFINNNEPGLSAQLRHENFLGRGNRIGTEANLGRPRQGLTLFLTENGLLGSDLDLTLTAGMTDDWGRTRVEADPADPVQFERLAANYSIVNEVLLDPFGGGPGPAAGLIRLLEYRYPSVTRLWQAKAGLARRRGAEGVRVYQVSFTADWTRFRVQPLAGRRIDLDIAQGGAFDDPFGDDAFGDDGDNPFGDDGSGSGDPSGRLAQGGGAFPYDDGWIPIDGTWQRLLTDRANTLNFGIDLARDTRDNQLAPTRGGFLRLAGLFAWEYGGDRTRVLGGEVEARNYLRVRRWLVWAQALRGLVTGSLRRDRYLPQGYWIQLGGEGSVRGVNRDAIGAVGGGRAGINLRNELRLQWKQVGLVVFWDRAGVWRRPRQADWSSMVDGFGGGLRWDPGLPMRLDLGWGNRLSMPSRYLSVGHAF